MCQEAGHQRKKKGTDLFFNLCFPFYRLFSGSEDLSSPRRERPVPCLQGLPRDHPHRHTFRIIHSELTFFAYLCLEAIFNVVQSGAFNEIPLRPTGWCIWPVFECWTVSESAFVNSGSVVITGSNAIDAGWCWNCPDFDVLTLRIKQVYSDKSLPIFS